jgi:DNA-directed RNA polymerase II subunit RPB7
MFFLRTLEREISIHPSFLNSQVHDRLKAQLYTDLEGSCNGEYYCTCIMDILKISPGRVRPGSGDAQYTIEYRAILWKPFKGETVSKQGILDSSPLLTCL